MPNKPLNGTAYRRPLAWAFCKRSPDKVNATMGKVNAPRLAEVH